MLCFFLAGCLRVVVTAWPSVDDAAGPLLEHFHTELLGGRVGTAAALRFAQRAHIPAGDPPSAWGAFLRWGLSD